MLDKKYLQKYNILIGCDEVGRGPIAGPVNACAVKITDTKTIDALLKLNVTDSKKLTDKKRTKILQALNIDVTSLNLNQKYSIKLDGLNFDFCLSEHAPSEIDRMNILQASLSAMKNASDNLVEENSLIIIDGNKSFTSSVATETVVKGDAKSVCIGLASIIAKNFRDEKMHQFDKQYPGYNLKKNAGYPTQEHKDAVKNIGPSPIHRKSFKGVKEFL